MKLDYCYENSPICVPDGTPPRVEHPERYVSSTRAGCRAPHAWLDGDRSTLDMFGEGFVLVRLGDDPPDAAPLLEAAKARGVPMRAVALADKDIAALYEARLVLVRPDGHIAWRGDETTADPAAIIDRVRGAGFPATPVPEHAHQTPASQPHLL
jgi:hypothetical protein